MPFRQGCHVIWLGIVVNSMTIVPKSSTGYAWMIKVREVDGKICMDQGWAGFAITHEEIKIGTS
jgi:hypothetical protein